jgi:hypothetical protein
MRTAAAGRPGSRKTSGCRRTAPPRRRNQRQPGQRLVGSPWIGRRAVVSTIWAAGRLVVRVTVLLQAGQHLKPAFQPVSLAAGVNADSLRQRIGAGGGSPRGSGNRSNQLRGRNLRRFSQWGMPAGYPVVAGSSKRHGYGRKYIQRKRSKTRICRTTEAWCPTFQWSHQVPPERTPGLLQQRKRAQQQEPCFWLRPRVYLCRSGFKPANAGATALQEARF